MAVTLFVVYASHTSSLPSCEADTRCCRSDAQYIAYILARCPFSVRRTFIVSRGIGGVLSAAWVTAQRSQESVYVRVLDARNR